MINKETVENIAQEWLKGKDYFLVDVALGEDNKISVEIDHQDGVWIDDCANLSRFIEEKLGTEGEDYDLEVGSAGLGQPFKVLRQYECHVGKEVETLTTDGRKLKGILKEVDAEHVVVTVQQKIKPEGAKRPKLTDVDICLKMNEIKYTKYLISFK
ncbi:MAG: ribosome assembly cofactor RimP [Bacteroidaceae bacterium]|jgi:ribosome maturation factor RimP|nr:ribosome assembly cofactor RimP [Bacteroidaceae bacterium]